MKQRYELNGKKYNVDPTSEKGKAWLEKNPDAQLVGTIVPKKDKSSAQGATAEPKTAASNQETGQSQSNTESQSGGTSSDLKSRREELEGLKSDLDSSQKRLNNLESSIKDAEAFNNKSLEQSLVNEYNNVLNKYKGKASDYSEKSDLFNEDLDKYHESNEPKEEEEEFGWIDGIVEVVKSLGDKEERQKASENLHNAVVANFKERGSRLLLETMGWAFGLQQKKAEFFGQEEKAKEMGEYVAQAYAKLDKLNSEGGLEIKTIKGSNQVVEGMPEHLVEKQLLKFEDTGKGFVKGVKSGSAADVIGGTANFIMGTVESVVPAIITRGASIYPQMTAPMVVSYNREKARALYGDDPDAIRKLIENDEMEMSAPMALGLVASGLEHVGLKGITKYAVGKAYANKFATSLLGTMSQEGVTEWLQGGVTTFSDSMGGQKSVGEASKKVWDHMLSDEGLEEFLGGFIGGGAMGGTGRMLNRALRNDDSSIKDVNDAIDKLAELNTQKRNTKSKVVKESIQLEINEVERNLKDYVVKSRGLKNYLTDEQKSNLIDLLGEKDGINNKIKELKAELDSGVISKKDYGYALRSLNNQAKKISNSMSAIKQAALEAESNRQAEQAEKYIKEAGLEGEVKQMTSEEIAEMDLGGEVNSKDASNQYGFIREFGDGSFEIILNKDKPAIGVAAHEFLHAVLNKTLKGDPIVGKQLADALNEHVNTLDGDQSNFKERLKEYVGDENLGEETITLMSESILNGDLKFNEGFFTKIGDVIRRFLQEKGIKDIKFDTGRDVYNFIKDYNTSIKSGKVSKAVIKVAKEGAKGKLVDKAKAETKTGTKTETKTKSSKAKTKFSKADAKIPIDKLGKIDSDGNDMTEPGMGNFLYQAEADQVISTIKEEGYLDNLIAAKYKVRPVPQDFVQDVLAELTPHIKSFKPESNDSLFGWIQGQIANKAGNVYNKIYKDKGPARTVDVDATTSEGAPLVQIEADTDLEMQRIDEIGLDDEQVQEKSKFRRALKLDDAMVDKVINTVKKAFGTKLPDINTKKFKQALTKAFKTDLKKPMQDLMGKGKDYDVFLNKFMPAIYRNLPVEVLVQMERNLDPDLRIFTSSKRITKPTEVDKLISQGKLPKDTSRTSGPLLNTKLPYPGAAKVLAFFRGTNSQELLSYKKGASTYGTRKDVLAERTITEVAFDAVSTVIQDEVVASKIEDLNIAGIDKVENDLAMIGKQIDRDPTIKFSMSGAKKPSGYTSDALIEHSNILIADIKQHGYESVIEEVEDKETGEITGKLVDGYKDLNIPQFTVNAVVNWHSTGNIDDSASVGYKTVIKGFKKVFSKFAETIDAYLAAGNLRYAKDHLNQLSKDAGVIANILGEDVMNAIGWEILGYKNRIMDPAKTKKDGSEGEFYDRLESSKKDVKGKESKLPKGLNPSDVNIMNIGAPGSLFKDIMKILKKDISKQEKLDLLAKLQPRIDAANKANILMAKHVAKTIVTLAREGKISPVSALHILQSQTSIVNGFRGLSRLDLIDVRDGSQAVNENHPSYKDAVKYYKKKGLSEAEAKIEALKKLGFKGEHLGPNSNTMAAIAKLIFDTNADIDKALSKAFRGHSQLLTSKYITDIIDDKGGRTNDTDFNRVKFLDKADIDNMVSAANQSYIDVLANHEVNILIEDLFVDNSKAVELQALESKPVSVKYSKSKGMSTFDFDETLIIGGKNFVVATHPKTKDVVKIMSHDWPIKGPALASQGYSFDFSDFANVRGGKEGPLLQKMKNQIEKYGNKNVFVLTARQQASAGPIHQWLKSKGISIPLRNITGLGKSEGSAKGEWMLQKFAEGYNDMYFVDDALPNVEAVKKVLDQLDIKSKVVQAKVKFSKSASQDFNKMLERSKGIAANQEFSSVEAALRGAKKGRFKFFVPPSAEDFKGLIYAFLGTGKQGDQDLVWFKDNLLDPFAKGIRELNSLRQRMTEEYSALKKQFPNVVKSLNDKVGGTDFTVDNAIRVYLWNMAGFEVPGISESQKKLLIDHVAKNAELVAFADVLSNITRRPDGYVKPKDFWIAQNIGSDLHGIAEGVNREEFLTEWKENKDLVFSKENLNKIEAIYGTNFREALEDILYRMETGSNRPTGRTSTENKFINWINGSVGAVMFLNMRSAALQGLSMVNFLNFEDNNIFAAAKAFANQKQFWSDFIYLINSYMLKQRRAGLKIDVSASELTDAFKQGQNKTEAVIKYLLEKGFTPTKMMDSFAIAIGGSTFYRNKINKYLKQGMSQSEAESQAFLDFQEIAEETQQSSRPDLISMQQASSLGRLILAWANTPMQYTRLTKKALSDIVNGRGDLKANVSKILYYGAVQNIIFGSLQTGLAFLMFGDDEDDEDRDKKETRVLNGMLDTLLRGVGVYGALVSAVKNTLITAHEELGKGYGKKDYSKIMQQLISLSPPIGSKVRKIVGAIKTYDFNKDVMKQMDHGINNPAWNMFANVIEGVTNAPVGRIQNKLSNVREAIVGDHEMWQRVALVMGWSKWDVGVKDADVEEARKQVKENRKEEKKKTRAKKFKCSATRSNGERCSMVVDKKGGKCVHHRPFKDGSDSDGDGKKEYQCRAKTSSGKRCKNKTENKNKKCYAHQ